MGESLGELLGKVVGVTEGLGLGLLEGLGLGFCDVEGASLGAKGMKDRQWSHALGQACRTILSCLYKLHHLSFLYCAFAAFWVIQLQLFFLPVSIVNW